MALTQVTSGGIKDSEVKNADMADDSVGIAELSATGTAGNTTYLRGDNTWTVPPDTDTQYTHPNHSGEVTSVGDGATTITDDVVDEANLKISNTPTDGYILTARSGNVGGMTWEAGVLGGGGTGTDYDDNVKARWGTHHDLEIYHDSNNSFIDDVGTGQLYLRGGGDVYLQVDLDNTPGAKNSVVAASAGFVKLYYNGNEKLATTDTGIILTGDVKVGDTGKLIAGNGDDLKIYHDSVNTLNFIEAIAGNLRIRVNNGENAIQCIAGGTVELYHDDIKTLETDANGAKILGPEGGNGELFLYADEGDDNADKWKIKAAQDGTYFYLQNYNSGSWETNIKAVGDGQVELYYNNYRAFFTDPNGAVIMGPEGGSGNLYLYGDEGDDNNDKFAFVAFAGELSIQNYTSGSWENSIKCNGDGNVELYHDNAKMFWTESYGAVVKRPSGGSTTLEVIGCEGQGAAINMFADDGDDDADKWQLWADTSGPWILYGKGSGSWKKSILAEQEGLVKIYHNGNEKIETLVDGAQVIGALKATDVKVLTDAGKLYLNDDFSIYHDGSHSYLRNATGDLTLYTVGTEDVIIKTNSEDAITCTHDGSVALYYNGDKKFWTDDPGITVQDVGNVQIKLQSDGGNTRGLIYADTNDYIGFLDDGENWRIRATQSGYQFFGTDHSDRDLKDNITTITGTSLDKITKLVPKSFNWKQDDSGKIKTTETYVGFIAQDVKEHLPSLVTGTDGNKDMGLDYRGLFSHAIKALTELSAEVDTLKTKVAALEAA